MKMKACEAMVECLKAENIKVVFGYPGAAICPFYDALMDSGIKHVLVRHEANAGHEASGMARITGKPAVCVVTSGPGAVNLITAIATAYADSIPIVCITGQVNTDQIGSDVFQEADITGAAEPFVKHSYLVKDPRDIPRVFKEAFYIAGSGRPGPVLIDMPMDVQRAEIDFKYPKSVDIRSYRPTLTGNAFQVKRVMAELVKTWDEMGYRVVVITEKKTEDEYELPGGVTRYCLPAFDGMDDDYKREHSGERIALLGKIIREEHIDLMVSHQWLNGFLIWDMLAAKINGAKYCIHCHSVFSVPCSGCWMSSVTCIYI